VVVVRVAAARLGGGSEMEMEMGPRGQEEVEVKRERGYIRWTGERVDGWTGDKQGKGKPALRNELRTRSEELEQKRKTKPRGANLIGRLEDWMEEREGSYHPIHPIRHPIPSIPSKRARSDYDYDYD